MVLAKNVIVDKICGLAMVVSVFVAMRNWPGGYASGGDCTGEV
jgi:hypothetical protein